MTTLRVGEGSASLNDSDDFPEAFPPHSRRAPGVIAALVAHDHVPTINDLEFDALCSDSGSDLGFPTSDENEPPSDRENKGPPTLMTPALGRANVASRTGEMGRHGW